MFRKAPRSVFAEDDLTATFEVGDTLATGSARAVIRSVTLAVIAVIAWAALTPVYEVVSGEGQIVPVGDTERIEHLDGGIVARIAVREGARVEPGDALVELDGTDLEAERDKLRLEADRARAEAERVRTFLDGGPEDWRAAGAISEETAFRLAQVAALQAEGEVALAQRSALDGLVRAAEEELALQSGKARRYDAASAGAISRNDRDAVARDTLRLRATVAQLTGDIAIKDAAITLGRANAERLLGEIRADARARLETAQAEAARLARSLDQVEARIGRLTLRADRAGTVGELTVRHPGQIIAPGETVAEIVPLGAENVARVEIPADRIGGVAVGSAVSLKILTYDYTRFGNLAAEVTRIAPTSVRRDDGTRVFPVEIALLESDLGGVMRPTPGLTVVADIRTERRTVLSYLLKPMRVLSDRAFTES